MVELLSVEVLQSRVLNQRRLPDHLHQFPAQSNRYVPMLSKCFLNFFNFFNFVI